MFFNKTAYQFIYLCFKTLFGDFNEFFISLVVFMLIDFVIGTTKAFIKHEFEKATFKKGLGKKICILLLVCCCNLIEIHLFESDYQIRNCVMAAIIQYESISIIGHI